MDRAAGWCCCLAVPLPRPHSRGLPLTRWLKAAPRGRIHLQGQKWPLCVGLGLSSARRQCWTGGVSRGMLGPGLQTGWAVGVSVSRVLGGSYQILVVPAASPSHCNVAPEGIGAASTTAKQQLLLCCPMLMPLWSVPAGRAHEGRHEATCCVSGGPCLDAPSRAGLQTHGMAEVWAQALLETGSNLLGWSWTQITFLQLLRAL